MTTQGIDVAALSDRLEAVGVVQNPGETTGYLDLDSPLNLNAIAIGLGLENIAYDPEKFPGLIYHREEPQATVILFDNGVITRSMQMMKKPLRPLSSPQ